MSLNDRCREAVEALDSGGQLPDTPAVREFIRSILMESADGIRFPIGIREFALAIRDAARDGGSVSGGGIIAAGPPSFVPSGGICWRAPDGSHEWIMPTKKHEPSAAGGAE